MLFITPLLSLALATLAAAQEPPKAIFYKFNDYQGSGFTIYISGSSPCYNWGLQNFSPRSAKLDEGVRCFLYTDHECKAEQDRLTSGAEIPALHHRQGSVRCELVPKF
ncbi:hypothetical protein V499_01699 [Pseudogymnoascus sp. VKM F-103]|nr:hypothetical protein V499_01699 [Pseudogymnoascus sp. VKM F-103]